MGYSRHALDDSSLQMLLETASTVFTILCVSPNISEGRGIAGTLLDLGN